MTPLKFCKEVLEMKHIPSSAVSLKAQGWGSYEIALALRQSDSDVSNYLEKFKFKMKAASLQKAFFELGRKCE